MNEKNGDSFTSYRSQRQRVQVSEELEKLYEARDRWREMIDSMSPTLPDGGQKLKDRLAAIEKSISDLSSNEVGNSFELLDISHEDDKESKVASTSKITIKQAMANAKFHSPARCRAQMMPMQEMIHRQVHDHRRQQGELRKIEAEQKRRRDELEEKGRFLSGLTQFRLQSLDTAKSNLEYLEGDIEDDDDLELRRKELEDSIFRSGRSEDQREQEDQFQFGINIGEEEENLGAVWRRGYEKAREEEEMEMEARMGSSGLMGSIGFGGAMRTRSGKM